MPSKTAKLPTKILDRILGRKAKPASQAGAKTATKTPKPAKAAQGKKKVNEGTMKTATKSSPAARPKLQIQVDKSAKKAAVPAKVAKAAAGKKAATPPPAAAGKQATGKQGAAAPAGKGGRPSKPGKNINAAGRVMIKESTLLLSSRHVERKSHGAGVCREIACESQNTTGGYCRLHYIKNWKKIKRKELILKEHKLNRYIEELVAKYPDKYIEAIRQDLSSEKEFSKVVSDLEIDEGVDEFENDALESAEGIIDNIKREVEDDGDVF